MRMDDIVNDTISRQVAIKAADSIIERDTSGNNDVVKAMTAWKEYIEALPPAQPERDIPKKPNETTDRTWGIPKKQAVCPNCDAYLGMIHFISENGKTKVTYCESCGQAINWEGWDFDE